MSVQDWAQMIETARGLRVTAITLEDLANARRCPNRDSGGAQCTQDNRPGHQCRVEDEDLPR